MKKLYVSILVLITSTVFAKQLVSYNEIVNAIKNGKRIIVVTDFSKCTTPMSVSGQSMPTDIMIANNSVIFSVTHFTTNNPSFKGQAVNEYTTYTLKQDNSLATMDTQVISLPGYQISPYATNTCELNKGITYYTK